MKRKKRKARKIHPQGGVGSPAAPLPRDTSARDELLALHRRIWEENKRRIDKSSRDDTGELKRYRVAYTRATADYREVASFGDLVGAALGARSIYVGDYHTSKQSQKTFLKLVRRMHEGGGKLAIALELLPSRHQRAVDRYLAGSMPEAAFLHAIRFHRNWPFDNWENFRPIFDFARETGTPIIAIDARIDGSDSLAKRDEHAAAVIARAMKQHPARRFLTLIGDLHVAPTHLPRAVDRARAAAGLPAAKPLLCFQNSERIYWRLAARELERSVEVVRLDDESWCVMNTPPIILQQTYLNWLEREEDVLDYADARTEFLTLLRRIAGFLEIDLPRDVEDVEVYTCGDLSFLDRLQQRRLFSREEIGEIKRQIRSAESYFIPRGKMVYLANLSTNHAAEEASHYLKILCAPEELPMERVAAFYANTLHEAIGFFGSKIINDRRKTPHESDFERLLRDHAGYGAIERRIARLVLSHKQLERQIVPLAIVSRGFAPGPPPGRKRPGSSIREAMKIYREPVDAFIGVTHALGYMLGEKLFYAMVAGTIPKSTLRDLYFDPFTAPGRARNRYFELIARTKDVRIPERT